VQDGGRPAAAGVAYPYQERGVAMVDVRAGRVVALLEFQTAVEEIFDVQLLPSLRFPEVVGFQKDEIHHTFIAPRAGWAASSA
jgi:hypothetical protein